MQISGEAFTAAADIVSFVLVTPELASRKRIEGLREKWRTVVPRVLLWIIGLTATTGALLFLVYKIAGWTQIIPMGFFEHHWPTYYWVLFGLAVYLSVSATLLLMSGPPTIIVAGLIFNAVEALLVRRILFAFGVFIFVLSRLIMLWHGLS